MEPTSPLTSKTSQSIPQKSPNPELWGKHWQGFSEDQRKAFMRTLTQDFSHLIYKQMRKMHEASKRLKESLSE